MSQFSSKKAIEFSFLTYRKNFLVLVTASAIMAVSSWFFSGTAQRIAQKSGISHALDIAAIAKEQGHPATAWSVMSQVLTNLKTIPGHYYIALLFVGLLGLVAYSFLMLGFINLCLTLKDTGYGSLKLLFSLNFAQVKHFAGASFLFCTSMVLGFLSVGLFSALIGTLCRFFLTVKMTIPITTVLCVFLLGVVLFWSIGYVFFGLCIIDKPSIGSFEALQMSAAFSKGFRIRIIKTCALIFLLVMFFLIVLLVPVVAIMKMLFFADYKVIELVHFATDFMIYPFVYLSNSYLYRSLNPVK
jgi:hypothetical protein